MIFPILKQGGVYKMEMVKETMTRLFDSGLPINDIAKVFNVSRQTIHAKCKQWGIKRIYVEAVTCARCNKQFEARIKLKAKYCPGCYHEHLKDERLSDSYRRKAVKGLSVRQWQRKAREIAGKALPLRRGHVVHHLDGDITNNVMDNLFIFYDQSLHAAYHHRFRSNSRCLPVEYIDGVYAATYST